MNKKNIDNLGSAAAQFKRLAISNFWLTRADTLERQAVVMFRDAGQARENSKTALYLPDDGADKVFDMITNQGKDSEVVKTIVETEEKGKVN